MVPTSENRTHCATTTRTVGAFRYCSNCTRHVGASLEQQRAPNESALEAQTNYGYRSIFSIIFLRGQTRNKFSTGTTRGGPSNSGIPTACNQYCRVRFRAPRTESNLCGNGIISTHCIGHRRRMCPDKTMVVRIGTDRYDPSRVPKCEIIPRWDNCRN